MRTFLPMPHIPGGTHLEGFGLIGSRLGDVTSHVPDGYEDLLPPPSMTLLDSRAAGHAWSGSVVAYVRPSIAPTSSSSSFPSSSSEHAQSLDALGDWEKFKSVIKAQVTTGLVEPLVKELNLNRSLIVFRGSEEKMWNSFFEEVERQGYDSKVRLIENVRTRPDTSSNRDLMNSTDFMSIMISRGSQLQMAIEQ